MCMLLLQVQMRFHNQGEATMRLRYQQNGSTNTHIVHDLLQDLRAIYLQMY